MSTKETGGPAFPCSENGTSHTTAMAAMLQLPETVSTDEKDKVYIQTKANAIQGMTLRDYLAAKAMQGIYARIGGSASAGNNHDGLLDHVAEDAYAMADAMIAARGGS